MSRSRDTDVTLSPDESNVFLWEADILGPPDTPFEGGVFKVSIRVPESYPMTPPTVTFRTKIFHPNVHFKTGEVCLDILKTAWSPAWTLQSVCRAVRALLSDPAADSPLNCDAGNLLRGGDLRGYETTARMYTIDYAMQG